MLDGSSSQPISDKPCQPPSGLHIRFFYYLYQVYAFFIEYRSLAIGFVVVAIVTVLDLAFNYFLSGTQNPFVQFFFWWAMNPTKTADIGFAPEVWLSVLGLTLGTLIVIISIASQNIPKLIDLYIEDWVSLFYVWFMVIAGAHAIFIKIYSEMVGTRIFSIILNVHFFLPTSIFLSLPYIFYILKTTEPATVLKRIFMSQLRQIENLKSPYVQGLLTFDSFIREFHSNLFKSLSQLDNFLEYVSFKEAKAQIIQDMSILTQEYIKVKPKLNDRFFTVTQIIRNDISFRTMLNQFEEMEKTRSFYEQKCFRLLGNTYIKLLEDKEFDLASLCGLEICRIGIIALECKDDPLLGIVIIRFNTMLRFALKHGVRNNEARNLYNIVFHYRNFIANLILNGKIAYAKQSFFYLRIYGTEIFKHGRISPSMYFIVDVFAAEMKELLILVHQQQWPLEIQLELLNEMLQVDSPPDFAGGDLDRGQLLNNGVRILQIGLGLYYLKADRLDFVQRIIADLLDDLEYLGENSFRQTIELTFNRLRTSSPHFWEDTDRGNLNLYYTPCQDQIEPFREILYEQMRLHLLIIRAIPDARYRS